MDIPSWIIIGKYVDVGKIDLTKADGMYIKADLFKAFLRTFPLFKSDKLNYFYVEEALMSFSAGASMAQTIAILQKFNAVCCYNIYKIFDKEPVLLNASSARSKVGIKVPKKVKAKPFVFEHIKGLNEIPDLKWEYKKTGKIKDYCMDMTDSYVIAKAGYILNHAK